MAYSEAVLSRARARLAAQKAECEADHARRVAETYEKYPRLREIDAQLRRSMAQVIATTFRKGGDPQAAIAQLKTDNLQLQRERNWILDAEGLGEDFLDDAPLCPHCGGTGYVGAKMCACLQSLCRDEQRKALSHLLGDGTESFESFRLERYPDEVDPNLGVSPRKVMSIVLAQARQYARTFCPEHGSLLFSGAPGLGKTFLSACIARSVVAGGWSVTYETAVQLFADYESEKFGGASGKTRRYQDCDLLIIDDLGTEMVTQFTVSALYTVLNSRLLSKKPTIISTNLSMDEMARRYSPQIISRISGLYTCFRFYGTDLRKKTD
ncbi:MAG: ATP-binding protein [Oscillospiraceae bacterium]|nr:ATP-binding protein [Oscillospiraceae bacterium]